MKKIAFLLALVFVSLLSDLAGNAQNPFTAKAENQHLTPKPPAKGEFFVKISLWQYQIKQSMSDLIRQAKTTGNLGPLCWLIAFAFVYGVIHSLGPGHGKAIALSYILSRQPSFLQGLIFGNLIALFHGLSGILLVLTARFLLQTSISGTLEEVTDTTQMISFSLVTCLGFIIFFKGICKWTKRRTLPDEKHISKIGNPYASALAVGIIPCPGVVMVMLFAVSMDLTWLGIILGLAISFGMALTITCIVMIGILGKVALLSIASRHRGIFASSECLIESAAGLGVAMLGLLFLWTIV